jgi:hypothetical protein
MFIIIAAFIFSGLRSRMFTQYVYFGIYLPRTSAQQAKIRKSLQA